MPPTSSEKILRAAARRLVFRAVRAHPDWTLLDLLEHLDARAPAGAILRAVEISELGMATDLCRAIDSEAHPPSDSRLGEADQARGARFDAIVHEALMEARGPVRAGYLRERVGGPGWKLRRSLQRLEDAELAERTGENNATRYRARLR